MESRTYIRSVSVDSTQLALREAFSVHGEVTEVFVVRGWLTDQPRRVSSVTRGSAEQAERAISAFAGVDAEADANRPGERDERRGARQRWPVYSRGRRRSASRG